MSDSDSDGILCNGGRLQAYRTVRHAQSVEDELKTTPPPAVAADAAQPAESPFSRTHRPTSISDVQRMQYDELMAVCAQFGINDNIDTEPEARASIRVLMDSRRAQQGSNGAAVDASRAPPPPPPGRHSQQAWEPLQPPAARGGDRAQDGYSREEFMEHYGRSDDRSWGGRSAASPAATPDMPPQRAAPRAGSATSTPVGLTPLVPDQWFDGGCSYGYLFKKCREAVQRKAEGHHPLSLPTPVTGPRGQKVASVFPSAPTSAAGTPLTPRRDRDQGGAPQFEQYLSEEECVKGIRGELEGRMFVRGTMDVPKKYTSSIAFVRVREWPDCDIMIDGKQDRNRALPGDVVIVEILPRSKWLPRDETWRNSSAGQADAAEPPLKPEKPTRLADGRTIKNCISDPPRLERLPGGGAGQVRDNLMQDIQPPHTFSDKEFAPTGRIVRVWRKGHRRRQVCRAYGSALKDERGGGYKRYVRFATYDDRYPHILVKTSDLRSQFEQTLDDIRSFVFYLELDEEWLITSHLPWGKPLRLLGSAGVAEVESRAILAQCNTDYTDEFSDECMECIAGDFVVPTPEELKKEGRKDLRWRLPDGSLNPDRRFITTIDPATARDLDDALSFIDLGGGLYKVGVHIADVATFVKAGSALDEEAAHRATSVYLVQQVIPMLPRKLCEEYCSLNTISDKFAFTVEWVMNENGDIKSEWFGQTLIRSQCKMAYEHAQAIIDEHEKEGAPPFDPATLPLDHMPEGERPEAIRMIKEGVLGMWRIAKNIRKGRFSAGALALNQGKMAFDFEDRDSSLTPNGWHLHTTAEANWLVEEMMVRANCRAMEKCLEWLPDNSCARYHEYPDVKRFAKLRGAFADRSLRFDCSTGGAVRESLDAILATDFGAENADAIRAMSIRCMTLAKYCCSSESSQHSLRHYALHVDLYTHFTSPIRRYPDLLVHRCLKVALEIEKEHRRRMIAARRDPESVEGLDEVISLEDIPSGNLVMNSQDMAIQCEHSNERKQEARQASDMSIKLFFCLFLQAKYQKWRADRIDDPLLSDRVYKEECVGTLMGLKPKVMSIWLNLFGFDRDVFNDNGQNDQTWIGTNKVTKGMKCVIIEWEPGLVQVADLLTSWKCLVYYREASQRMDFTCELLKPDASLLRPKEDVLAEYSLEEPKEKEEANTPATATLQPTPKQPVETPREPEGAEAPAAAGESESWAGRPRRGNR